MEKIQKLIPKKVSIDHKAVVIPDSLFNEIFNLLNLQSETINQLIDALQEVSGTVGEHDTKLTTLNNSVQTIANALKTVMEE